VRSVEFEATREKGIKISVFVGLGKTEALLLGRIGPLFIGPFIFF
jgi:hypothetical protein